MDLNRIFMKNITPTKVGGQAILEGIMMRGADRTATVIRMPDDSLHIKTEKLPEPSRLQKIPFIRGVFAFVASLVMGTKIIMYSADVLESYDGPGKEDYEDDKLTLWLNEKFGKEKAWNIMIYSSVVISIIFTVGIFVLLPTALLNLVGKFIENAFVLNLIEGLLRITMFIVYVAAIRFMPDIKRVFKYHGAEHKTIHCFENNLDLTVENVQPFYTLHPRCGTSFMMFVMIISLILFSLLGWPGLIMRVASRLLLLPIVAGISYELLRWAGRSDSTLVKILSMPGIMLQMLTTAEPDDEMVEVAIAAVKATLVDPETPCYEGTCDLEGRLIDGTTY